MDGGAAGGRGGPGAPGGGAGEGRRRLGGPLPGAGVPACVPCPHCGGADTELMTAFGSALSVSQYWCRPCRTVFEFMKWRAGDADGS
ncbi:MAG: hypothetical protein RRA92_03900 [Gemmatimonadota bacterium]|nr:hypothetical protein [Gemmatimonadota bacterium]